MEFVAGQYKSENKIPVKINLQTVLLLLRLKKCIKSSTQIAGEWIKGNCGATSKEQKASIKKKLSAIYNDEELEALWDGFENRGVLDNPGLSLLVEEFGSTSRAFMDALSVAPSSRILRTALGLDVFGYPIPEADKFGQLMRLTPTFAGLNYRYNFLADKMLEEAQSVAILACGDMLELLVLKEKGKRVPENIVACDIDAEVTVRHMEHTKAPNIDFRQMDLFSVLESLEDESRDRIIAPGVCSYMENELQHLLTLAEKKLKPGGILSFDLQIKGSHESFNDNVLGWSIAEFKPAETVDDAISAVKAAAAGLPIKSITYYMQNERKPFEIILALQK